MTGRAKFLAGFALAIAVSVAAGDVVSDVLGDWAASRIGGPWWLPWILLGLFWGGYGVWMWRRHRASRETDM